MSIRFGLSTFIPSSHCIDISRVSSTFSVVECLVKVVAHDYRQVNYKSVTECNGTLGRRETNQEYYQLISVATFVSNSRLLREGGVVIRVDPQGNLLWVGRGSEMGAT